jgi:hypothetical protein
MYIHAYIHTYVCMLVTHYIYVMYSSDKDFSRLSPRNTGIIKKEGSYAKWKIARHCAASRLRYYIGTVSFLYIRFSVTSRRSSNVVLRYDIESRKFSAIGDRGRLAHFAKLRAQAHADARDATREDADAHAQMSVVRKAALVLVDGCAMLAAYAVARARSHTI